MKKRILSILLVALMVMSVLPLSAFATSDSDAELGDVVYGHYDNGTWVQDPSSDGTTQDRETGISLRKTAVKTGDNTYDITLEVSTQQTTTVLPGSAATVLVIDTSGSMNYCADCGGDESHKGNCPHRNSYWVTSEQSRIAAAEKAALDFLDTYKSDSTGIGRYVAIVNFAKKASTACSWVDVSTEAGYNKAKSVINDLFANGGTNLDDGLYRANSLLNDKAVSGIAKAQKNVIALTDGAPTYSRNSGDGKKGSATINNETSKTASTLKENASVYTVCFGVADELTYRGNHGRPDGPTVGDFLKDSIATLATSETTYAYNADNSSELYKAFKNITKTITEGADGAGWTVTDPMGDRISATEVPDAFVKADNNTYTWSLSNPEVTETNGVKTFTYTLTYTVQLDNSAEDFNENTYYPTNKTTTLTAGDKTLEFPIPGVKGTLPLVSVKYEWDGNIPADAELPAGRSNAKSGDNILVDTKYAAGSEVVVAGGYYTFSGWSTTDTTIADGQFTMPNKDVTLHGTWSYQNVAPITITAKSDTVTYNGTEQSVSGYDVEGLPDGYTLEGISASVSAVHANTYDNEVTGTPIIKDETGKDVTSHFAITTNKGSLIIEKAKLTITSLSSSKVYDGAPLTYHHYTQEGLATASDTLTVDFTGTITDVGEVDNTFNYELTNANDYEISVTYGKLTISSANSLTVAAPNVETIYNNTPHSTKAVASVNGEVVEDATILYQDENGNYTLIAPPAFTNVGNYTVNFKASKDNYDDAFGSATIHITPAKLTIVSDSASKPYDGTPLTAGYTETGLAEGDALTVVVTGTITNFGFVDNTFNYVLDDGNDGKNYEISTELGVLTVDKAKLTITSGDATKLFDGLPLTCDEYTAIGLAAVDTLTMNITGTITEVGDTENEFTYELTNAENYDVTTKFGTLTVLEVLDKDNHFAYIVGYPDGSVQPEGQITREEVATIFFRLLTDETREFGMTKENNFSDIRSSRWSNTAISTLANLKIINGYPDGTFQPQKPITRAEMATIISRFAELTEGTTTFNDIDGHWAEDYIILAAANGWINGYEDGSFRPNQPITRAETMAMINRVLNRNPSSPDDLLAGMTTFTDNLNQKAWYYLDVQEATNSHYFGRHDNGREYWTVLRENRDWTEFEK